MKALTSSLVFLLASAPVVLTHSTPVLAAAGCQATLPNDVEGRAQRCCTPDTSGSYFLNADGSSRSCSGTWQDTQAYCAYGSKKATGVAWACNNPISTTHAHHLSATAKALGAMTHAAYIPIQKKWIGSTEAACNYFVITSMCQDGYCTKDVPDYTADGFKAFLIESGWKTVSLAELKIMFQAGADFDVIMERDVIGGHGHILIPYGVAANGELQVAEGELDGVSNEDTVETDSYLLNYEGGMTAYTYQQ